MPLLRCLLALLLLALAACAPLESRPGGGHAPLVLISIDGFRADYLQRGITPNLAQLAASGARAEGMRPAFPSLTFPNHYTLVTGLYPDHHGIVNNIFRDPDGERTYVYKDSHTTADPAWWGGEPIWVGAEKHGIRTATMFWPGSDVAIDGVRPSHWMKYDGRVSTVRRVDTVLRWFDLPPRERPRFLTLYFDQVDHAGHDFGPDSPEVNAAAADVDAAIGRLLVGLNKRGLIDKVNLVVVSDHGQAATSMDRVLYMDELIDLERARYVTLGIVAGFRPQPGDSAAVARQLLAPHEHFRCWRKEDLPPDFHYGSNPRIPPLVCLADEGWVFSTRAWVARKKGQLSRGEHGYDPALPQMRALFVAHGPAFVPGASIPVFDNVNVYPLLAHLLGVPPAPNDGDLAVTAPLLKSAR